MKKKILYAAIIMSFILISVFTVLADLSNTKIYAEPASIMNKKLRIGDTFTVNISIADVTNLKGYEFKLKYNKNILNAMNITKSTFLSYSPYCIVRNMNNTEGLIWIACMMPLNSGAGVSGSGTLETITFKIMNKGESDIELQRTVLGDSNGNEITHVVNNGYFRSQK